VAKDADVDCIDGYRVDTGQNRHRRTDAGALVLVQKTRKLQCPVFG
jgi:hypothetical protein